MMSFFRNVVHNFARNTGKEGSRYEMASSRVIEEEDLIDLEEDGGAVGCASRSASLPEASAEELEHLLDVCPPQLEQKLSLTREQDSAPERPDGEDVLVTLGHDKLVPRRKRIDVVSSETIKRIRDITKNLEPVIRNCETSRFNEAEINGDHVDAAVGTTSNDTEANPRRDIAYETQAINTAFDFLSELEDDEDEPPDKKRRRNADHEAENDGEEGRPTSHPLEPTCLVQNGSTDHHHHRHRRRYRDVDRANREVEADDETLVIERPSDDDDSHPVVSEDHENPGFEVSPISKICPPDRPPHAQKHSVSLAKPRRGPRPWNEPLASRDERDRRSDERSARKSWSEGETRGLVRKDDKNGNNFERSTSVDVDRLCEPSTSNGITTLLRRSSRSIFRQGPSYSASSSECSDVDWSWVEEYEARCARGVSQGGGRGVSSLRTIDPDHGRTTGEQSWRLDVECSSPGRVSSAPTSVTTSAKGSRVADEAAGGATWASGSGNGRKQRARAAGSELVDEQSTGSVAMSVVVTGKATTAGLTFPASSLSPGSLDSEDSRGVEEASTTPGGEYDAASTSDFDLDVTNGTIVGDDNRISGSFGFAIVDERPGSHNDNRSSRARATTNNNSWLRASMRRIRHLRMPENDQRAVESPLGLVTSSGPNSLPDIALVAPEVLAAQTNARPSSAPADRPVGPTTTTTASPRRGRRHAARISRDTNNERSTARNILDETRASDNADVSLQTSLATPTRRHHGAPNNQRAPSTSTNNNPSRRICERQRDSERENERGDDDDEDENPLGRWPHPLSPALACLGCTLGIFNISRFAILSIQFGANFIVQFLVLSLILGIPLLTLQVCLGQRLAAGAVDMWRISPIFHGVGIALLVAQAFIGIYSIIGVSWMFVYFRDSFITKQDRYRWAEPFLLYRDDTRMLHNMTDYKITETVPDYFSGVVLQRHHLNEPEPGVVTLKFQVAFNLAVVWMIVFVSLSKGLRSYGKVVYVFTLVPVFGTLVLCTKLLGLTPPGSIHQLFPATVWREFFINSKSWIAASSEVFLTWGLFGAAAMQIAAHNKHKHLLQRDTSLVVVLTFVVLLLSAFLANTCVQILQHYGYHYVTNSFERISGYTFMRHVNQQAPSGYSNTPERFMSHASFLLGQRVVRPGTDLATESGYQALRLSTELVPATLAILGTDQVSPFWAVLFYFILILFGIAQQLAIWHCVITGIMAINTKMMKLWETTITFFSCACAYILGLPMATEVGIYVVYYLDYTVGGAWWIMVLYLVQVGAVFAVRGRPHTGETVVAELFPPTGRCLRHWAGPLLSFTWNVILPVALMVLSITVFKSSSFRDLYVYRRTSRDYWSVWARQLGAAIQLTPILIIPGVAIIQTCRYLNSGPPDIFDRIQLLYRPPLDTTDATNSGTNYGNETSTSIHGNGILPTTAAEPPFEDPPPKYTPPPSYTTATGARIAKMLRQSFRRSVRRIASVLGETSTPRARPALQPPPPDYATVLVEMNQSALTDDRTIPESQPPDITDTRRSNARIYYHDRNRPRTIDRMTRISTIDRSSVERTHSTMDRGSRARIYNTGSSNLTAADVANLLRSSIRRGAIRGQRPNLCGNSLNDPHALATSHATTTTAASVENLVNAAVPINEDFCDKDVPLVHDDEKDNDQDDKKTVNETDDSVSVI